MGDFRLKIETIAALRSSAELPMPLSGDEAYFPKKLLSIAS